MLHASEPNETVAQPKEHQPGEERFRVIHSEDVMWSRSRRSRRPYGSPSWRVRVLANIIVQLIRLCAPALMD